MHGIYTLVVYCCFFADFGTETILESLQPLLIALAVP